VRQVGAGRSGAAALLQQPLGHRIGFGFGPVAGARGRRHAQPTLGEPALHTLVTQARHQWRRRRGAGGGRAEGVLA